MSRVEALEKEIAVLRAEFEALRDLVTPPSNMEQFRRDMAEHGPIEAINRVNARARQRRGLMSKKSGVGRGKSVTGRTALKAAQRGGGPRRIQGQGGGAKDGGDNR